MKILKIITQLVIGVLFIVSGLFKALDSAYFNTLVESYGLHYFSLTAPFISGIEIILGLMFILNIKTRPIALIIGILTTLFTILFSYAFFFNGVEDCGCMGSFFSTSPLFSFVRNFLIVIGCFWIWFKFKNENTEVHNWKKWIIVAVGSISFYTAGYTLSTPLFEKNAIKVGDQVNGSLFRFYQNRISSGRSLIYVFSPFCDHCWNATENIKSIRNTPGLENVIGVTFKDLDTSMYMQTMKPNFDVFVYPTDEILESFKEIPVLLVLENGKVVYTFTNKSIPCGPILKMMLENSSK